MSIKKIIKRFVPKSLYRVYLTVSRLKRIYYSPLKYNFWGYRADNNVLTTPVYVVTPKNVFLHENTKLETGAEIINKNCKFIVNRNSSLARNLTVVTMNHRSTVGIPHFLLGLSHVNDKEKDIIVEEDVWVGSNVTLVYGAHLSRGCIVGANSMVNRNIPPYAVVVGSPARIIAVKFSLEQIIIHEEKLYNEKDRMSKIELEKLFEEQYKDLKVFGTDSFTEEDKGKLEGAKMRSKYVER